MFVQAFSSGFTATQYGQSLSLSSLVKTDVLNFTAFIEERIWCKLPLGNASLSSIAIFL